MRVYIDTELDKKLRRQNVSDRLLFALAQEVARGLNDGELVANLLYKKRIPAGGQGRRDGLRSIVSFRRGETLFFIDVYSKNEVPKGQKEIPEWLLEAYKITAGDIMSWTDEQIALSLEAQEYREVNHDV
ncbi:type II toxin-antitoxin system RelE/ParE family toxin [Erwinia sp. BNK-24-b]|uniref:type II toxin-antitoxin system RelE/ParE family toxin n=1 Tax=unclassified Erwinia TaxID=2622719 RepID=UPI0039BF8B49